MSRDDISLGGKGAAAKLARWLRPLVFPFDVAKTPPATALWVKHVNVNEKTAEVRTFDLSEMTEARLAEVVRGVAETLADDAVGWGSGVQRYLVLAQDAAGVQIARLALRAKGEDADEGEGADGSSEPATGKGLLSQLMRHNEGIMRAALLGSAESAAQMARMNERLMQRVADQDETRLEMYTLMEELLSHRADRDNAAKEVAAKIENRKQMVKLAAPLVGALLSKATGRALPAAPGAPSATEETVKSIVQSITPDQVDQLEGILNPAQKIALLSLMEKFAPEESGEPDGAG